MVSTRQKASSPTGSGYENTQSWIDAVSKTFASAEVEVIRQACELAEPLYEGHTELTGTPLIRHALGAASILAGLNMDHKTIAAAILHAIPDYLDGWAETLETRFGSNVKMLVEGISRMEHIRQFSDMPDQGKKEKDKGDHVRQIESLRKMLLAMVQDIRVVLIKLAERTQTLR